MTRSRPERARCSARSTATRSAWSPWAKAAAMPWDGRWSSAAAPMCGAPATSALSRWRAKARSLPGCGGSRHSPRPPRANSSTTWASWQRPPRPSSRSRPKTCLPRLVQVLDERSRLERELAEARKKLALGGGARADGSDGVRVIGDVKLIARAVTGIDLKDLRSLADEGKKQVGSGVVAIVGVSRGRQGRRGGGRHPGSHHALLRGRSGAQGRRGARRQGRRRAFRYGAGRRSRRVEGRCRAEAIASALGGG